MIIDKNIPILTISISDNTLSQHYKNLSNESFKRFGYNNHMHIEGPTKFSNELKFEESRRYRNGSSRDWLESEKCIWLAHFRAWERVCALGKVCIVKEHDCIMTRPFDTDIDHPLFSFVATTKTPAHSAAAVGYIINPTYAKKLVDVANDIEIYAPVDGIIHKEEPWVNYGILDKDYVRKHVYARHFIDSSLGAVKVPIKEKRK